MVLVRKRVSFLFIFLSGCLQNLAPRDFVHCANNVNVIDSSCDNAQACKIKFIAALMLASETELGETT